MPNLPTIVFFISLLWGSNSHERKTQLQYWHHASLKEVFLLPNVTAVEEPRKIAEGFEKPRGIHPLSVHLQSVLPPFAVTSGNPQCKRDSETFLGHLARMELWALKMHDSSGKLPSGLLNGNINQFGDFDECVSIHEPSLKINGKYCLAYLQVRPNGNDQQDSISQAFRMMQSHFMFKSKLTDPGDRVPRFSTINWGLCVPSSCSFQDVEIHLKGIVDRYSNGTGFDVEVKIEPEMCQEQKIFKVSASFVLVSCFLLSIVAISILATLKDIFIPEESSKQFSFWSLMNCFSLKRNAKALVELTRSSDDIESVHGIRMLNALMLVLSHKSMALFFMPYSNRYDAIVIMPIPFLAVCQAAILYVNRQNNLHSLLTNGYYAKTLMVEKLNRPWTIIARTASLYTDSFVMISGLLSSYSFIKELKKKGNVNLKSEYMSRLIRIIPPLAVIILLSTFIIPELGTGPQWNLTVAHHADKCKKTWWKNFLFIHNYLGFENMCLTHTHHLGIDTQLFFISPFLVTLLFKSPSYGVPALVGLATLSTVARYQVTAAKNLSFFIYPGISVGQMFDTANFSYIIPFHRLTAYIIGIFLGYALRVYGKDYKMKSNLTRLGWTVTFSFLSYILTKANEMNHPNYVYSNREAASYAALAPIAWCLFWGWVVFISYTGCGGAIGKIISSKYWLIWTRLSYAVYLTQFPIFFFNVGLQKYSQQYSIFLLMNVLEYASVFVASVVLTLLFDMPFANMKKLIIPR